MKTNSTKHAIDNSVKHTIEFTTNVPGSKVSVLDPKNITYSDLFTKSGKMDTTIYIDSTMFIDDFGSMTREEVKHTLFNKTKYHNFVKGKQGVLINNDNKDDLIISYLTNIFTTYPKTHNVKQTKNLKKKINHGLKVNLPFKNDVYTYLNVNGTDYTISRVIFRNFSGDKRENKKFFELYEDYIAWRHSHSKIENRKMAEATSANILTKHLESIQKSIRKDPITITIKTTKNNETTKKDETETSYVKKELIAYLEYVSKIKHDYGKSSTSSSNTSERIDNMLEAFNTINNFDITTSSDIGNLLSVSKLIEAVHDVDSGWSSLNTDATLFRNFRINRELFSNFKKLLDQHIKKLTLSYDVKQNQYTDKYKDPNNFKGESMYKPFIDLNVHVSTHYEIYGTHNYDGSGGVFYNIKNHVYVPIVKAEGANYNEKLNLHFDLIKGKITDDNKGNIGCEYSDANLANRFDKLIGVIDDDPSSFDNLPLHEAVTKTEKPKQKPKGGKRKTKSKVNPKNKTRRSKK